MASEKNTKKKESHNQSIFLLHGPENIKGTNLKQPQKKGLPRINFKKFLKLSHAPKNPFLKTIIHPEKIALKIEKLRSEFERTIGTEGNENTAFELSLNYLKMYLYYLEKKYPYESSLKKNSEAELISTKELKEYLSRAEYYVDILIYSDKIEQMKGVSLHNILKATEDMSFKIDNQFLSVYFLAFIIETERIAGNWEFPSIPSKLNQKWMFFNGKWKYKNSLYREKTRKWLDKLWKRSQLTSINTPKDSTLFHLFDLFIKYDFLSRVITNFKDAEPKSDILIGASLKKAAILEKEALPGSDYYQYFYELSRKDQGNTKFLPYLFFAYKGYNIIPEKRFHLNRNALFNKYLNLFDKAVNNVSYNISFRTDIFQDIFIFSIDFNNLFFLENKILPYAKRALQLIEKKDDKKEIGESLKATMAYFIANILEMKKISGLSSQTKDYEEIFKIIDFGLLGRRNENWLYIASTYATLAEFYEQNEKKALQTKSLKYAKKAFLIFCKQIKARYGDKWPMYKKMKNNKYGKKFALYFAALRNKYPTNLNGYIPKEMHCSDILNDIVK